MTVSVNGIQHYTKLRIKHPLSSSTVMLSVVRQNVLAPMMTRRKIISILNLVGRMSSRSNDTGQKVTEPHSPMVI